MRFTITPKMFAGLLGLLFVPLLTACAKDSLGDRPQVGTPPPEWTEPVAWPVVPDGEAQCRDEASGETVACLSDRESADLLAALGDALDAANGKLQRLGDWFAELAKARR